MLFHDARLHAASQSFSGNGMSSACALFVEQVFYHSRLAGWIGHAYDGRLQ